MTTKSSASSIRAISRAVTVLRAINQAGPLTITMIAKVANLPFPTAYRIVDTLLKEGLIEREPSRKRYRPTALVQTLSCGFQNDNRIVTIARRHIVDLTKQIDWPITVTTRVGLTMMVRDTTNAMTSLTFADYYPGWQVPLVASASGRVYLAYAPIAERNQLLKQYEMVRRPADKYSGQELKSVLTEIRAQGYATAERNYFSANPGRTSSIAVPLFDGDVLIGALTAIFFAQALSPRTAIRKLLNPLRDTADAIRGDLTKAD